MNFLKCTMTALALSATFVACQKEKADEIGPVLPAGNEKPAPGFNESIQGLWIGHSVLYTKSIPVYFSFKIKADGKLDVLNAAQQAIGAGVWTFNGETFRASYSIEVSGGSSYSVVAAYFDSPGKLSGTWGFNSADSGGGFWEMDKVN